MEGGTPLSSRGPGRRPLTAETGVRIPVAVWMTHSGMDEKGAHVAQSAEHFLGKEEVMGSNPIVSLAPIV